MRVLYWLAIIIAFIVSYAYFGCADGKCEKKYQVQKC